MGLLAKLVQERRSHGAPSSAGRGQKARPRLVQEQGVERDAVRLEHGLPRLFGNDVRHATFYGLLPLPYPA